MHGMPDTTPNGPWPADPILADWSARLRAAATDRRRVRIQGGQSKAFYGNPPATDDAGSECLDTRAYQGIVAHEPTELVVTAKAGTPLTELEAALAAHGQCLPFEPPHFGPGATVGGMVAAGLSGPARASAGALRDYVLGLQMLNGRGECLTFGGQVMKNVAGYDLSRLLAGSLGTLGVIAEVSLKVLPVAPAEATLRFELPQAAALAQLARWRGQPLPLNASCWVHDTSGPVPQEVLYVRLRGAVAAVESACARLTQEVPGQRLANAEVAADWQACREQTLPFFSQAPSADHGLWRLSVAPTAPVLALEGAPLVEWFGGLRWTWAPLAEGPRLRTLAQAAGGHATLFRAPAAAPLAGDRFSPASAAVQAIEQRLRRAFDPAGIFDTRRSGTLT